MQERELKVTDKHGFVYRVDVKHWPETGISIAYYKGERIASSEYGRAGYPPIGDNDAEWEEWDELQAEWIDAATVDILAGCQEHFNRDSRPRRHYA